MKKNRFLVLILVLLGSTINMLAQSTTAHELWKKAIEHKNAQKYEVAIDLFKSLTIHPEYQEDALVNILKIANMYMGNQHYDDAIEALRILTFYPKYKDEAEKKIRECEKKSAYIQIGTQDRILRGGEELEIDYSGADTTLVVKSNYVWHIEDYSSGIKVEQSGKNNLRVWVVEENLELKKIYKYVTISSGNAPNKVEQTIKLAQKAHPAYLQCSSRALNFPAAGFSDSVTVHTNTSWSVNCDDDWCNVVCSSNNIKINVQENNSTEHRQTKVVVNSEQDSKLSIVVEINQTASEAELEVSKCDLYLPADRHVEYVRAFSNSQWYVSQSPSWAIVERVGSSDSIRVECYENRTGVKREEDVHIRTGNKVVRVHLEQETKPFSPEYNFDVLGGRNISFGFSAGYIYPIINVSSADNFIGSPVNYTLGNNDERCSYSSSGGFSVGMYADVRMYKNLYLKFGANFLHYNYKNEFNGDVRRSIVLSSNYASVGDTQNKYLENYKMNVLELPLIVSYRFPIAKKSHVQLNLGAIINCGISASLDVIGNTDSKTMRHYKIKNHQITNELADIGLYSLHYAVDARLDLYDKEYSMVEKYTIGNNYSVTKDGMLDAAPYNRLQMGTCLGIAYEYQGINVEVKYNLMLTNLANKKFWNGDRLTIFDQTNSSIMSGYEQRNNYLSIKLGYTFRY